MIVAGVLPLSGSRWTPFEAELRLNGLNLTGAAMLAQVRLTPDTPGAPLVDLPTVATNNTQGIRLVRVEVIDFAPVSTIVIRINEPIMEALPAAPELGHDTVLAWDLHINLFAEFNPALPAIKQRYLRGPFIVQSGVTQ